MYNKIMLPVGIDNNFPWEHVTSKMLNIIDPYQAQIHIINVVPYLYLQLIKDYLPPNWFKTQSEDKLSQLRALASKFIPREISTKLLVVQGNVYEEIIKYLQTESIDLIIFGLSKPKNARRFLINNQIVSNVIKSTDTPILILKG